MNERKKNNYWKAQGNKFRTFHELLSKESERGCVIVAAAMLDDALEKMIQARLLESNDKEDSLFKSPHPILGTFASKIELSYRLGLISESMKKSLDIVRKIRNDFAHNYKEQLFDDDSTKDKLKNMYHELNALFVQIINSCKKAYKAYQRDFPNKISNYSVENVDEFISVFGNRRAFELLSSICAAKLIVFPKRIIRIECICDEISP
ncbi:MAG: hypothetical protein U5O15_08065 [Candidatus Krumholzibacteriota bacterium]|nr:hypothetical protein [Candidatus Krumholzibacteriota bacterium]